MQIFEPFSVTSIQLLIRNISTMYDVLFSERIEIQVTIITLYQQNQA